MIHDSSYRQVWCEMRIIKLLLAASTKSDDAAIHIAFVPVVVSAAVVVSVAGKIHPEFLCLLWVLANKQCQNSVWLIGDEEQIGE